MHSRSQTFLQLLSAVSGNKGMRTNTHTRALADYLMALSLFALTLSLLAEDTHWPLRIRGSVELHTEYNNGNLIVGFQPGRGPADNGLQPGEASWLDRGFRPSEPHRLQQTISEGVSANRENSNHERITCHNPLSPIYCERTL